MNTTQEHLPISDILENILILKNGGGALVLQVSAVNFGLLSEREQIAIISAFAQMLNSLSFTIQIVIHSERLNISSYLTLLDRAQKAQTNPLLSSMMTYYRQFIQTTIKENEVLDKRFYIVIPLFNLELGLKASRESLEQKIKTILLPRRDQVIRQLNRVGLSAAQLNKQNLLELFYDIYNGQIPIKNTSEPVNLEQLAVKLKIPKITTPQTTFNPPPTPVSNQPILTQTGKNHPFVVEELNENT